MDVENGSPYPPLQSPDFSSVLRGAVEASGQSLAQLHRWLSDRGSPVSISTLSYWRSGARHPEGAQSRAAIMELERLLTLPTGTLTRLINPSRRPGQAPGPGEVFSDEYEKTRTELLAVLDADPVEYLREVSSSTLVQVGSNGGVREYRSRALMQATSKSVRSIPILFVVDEDASEPPTFFVSGGGSISDRFTHPNGTMVGARIDLDFPLAAPETAVLEYGFTLPEGYPPQRAAGHGSLRKASEMILWVHFSPDARPRWVAEFDEDKHGEREYPRKPLRGASAHVVRRGFGPGYVGLSWDS